MKLYDKEKQRDALYTSTVIRFRNLGIRNAWFSGKEEWNCGIIGLPTDALCLCTWKNREDIWRFYELEMTRETYYQMDFWLDENKHMTVVHIENSNADVVSMQTKYKQFCV